MKDQMGSWIESAYKIFKKWNSKIEGIVYCLRHCCLWSQIKSYSKQLINILNNFSNFFMASTTFSSNFLDIFSTSSKQLINQNGSSWAIEMLNQIIYSTNLCTWRLTRYCKAHVMKSIPNLQNFSNSIRSNTTYIGHIIPWNYSKVFSLS